MKGRITLSLGGAILALAGAALYLIALSTGCGDEATDCGPGQATGRSLYPGYGFEEGDILTNHEFVDAAGNPISLQDLRADSDNHLLLLSTSAGWCTACIQEQPELVERHEQWGDCGLVVLVTLFEDANFNAADASLAESWREQYELPFRVVADAPFVMGDYYDSALTPMNMFVDLNTMEILRISIGWDSSVADALIESRLQ